MIFRSFAGKIWLMIIAWVFMVVLIFGGILAKSTHDFYYGYAAEENEELTNTAASLSVYLADMPNFQVASPSFDFLGNLLKFDLLATNATGKVILSTHRLRDWQDFVMPSSDTNQIKQGKIISFQGSVPYLSQHVLKVATPIWQNNKVIGAVYVLEPFTYLDAVSRSVNHSIGWGLTLSFLLAIPVGLILAKKVAGPVVEMDRAVRDIATGNYNRRVTLNSTQELASLGQSVNTLSEEIRIQLEAINRERLQLANILTSIEDGVLTISPSKGILLANRVALQQFGRGENDKLTVNDLPQELRDLLFDVPGTGVPEHGEFAFRNQIYSVDISPLNTNHEHGGFVAVWHDVTKERRLEAMRREFVANVSHELRTPLSYLQGYAEALLDGVITDELQRTRYLKTILNETLRLRRLVNDLLDLNRIEFGEAMEFPHESTAVSPVVKNVCQQVSPLAEQKRVKIALEIEPNLPLVDFGSDYLKQVILNLVDNALRYSPEDGEIKISAKLITNWVEIAVTDEGPGISKEEQGMIWERFVRGSNGRNQSGGTGLGLAIVKSLVHAYHGVVDLKSVPGSGATFVVRLNVGSEA